MFLLSSKRPSFIETFHFPTLNFSVVFPNQSNVVTFDFKSSGTDEDLAWLEFHNGVAAGLQLSPTIELVDSSWVAYNKHITSLNSLNTHSGFLLAVGLQGHMKHLALWMVYSYLSKRHEATTLALLLGMAVAHRGSQDDYVYRLLSIHILALLPPDSTSLNITETVQTAAIMGLGLLFQNTCHLRIIKLLLNEIKINISRGSFRQPESYALAAGFALGFVALGHFARFYKFNPLCD
ncbi:anaphase-promoting complex subunit 1-like [Zophobas morio]|uniref:anaphase-promoting complex subunit 1-like n=1 Tax=Zophobas morio TaxID=2755281 RepID=UPI003083B4D9